MYRFALVALLLFTHVLTVFAQKESTPSATVEPTQQKTLEPTNTPHLPKSSPTEPPPTNTAAPTRIPGDANEDRQVDETDYSIWHSHYKQQVTTAHRDGDFNNDGVTDGIDYTIWLANKGTAPTSTPARIRK